MAATVCIHHKFGHCKYGVHCRHQHIDELCTNFPCNTNNCSKRHPKPCKYYLINGFCKFNESCSFSHELGQRNKNEVIEKEIEKLKEEVEALKVQVRDMRVLVNRLELSNTRPSSKSCITISKKDRVQHDQEQAIPQLDGAPPDVIEAPVQCLQDDEDVEHEEQAALHNNLQCENCHNIFETDKILQEHLKIHEFGCDECFICYKTKFHVDLHELEKHPHSTYARDHIPYTTKLQYAAGCRVPTSFLT